MKLWNSWVFWKDLSLSGEEFEQSLRIFVFCVKSTSLTAFKFLVFIVVILFLMIILLLHFELPLCMKCAI